MEKFLITGGSGFIGNNLIDFLSNKNCQLLLIFRNKTNTNKMIEKNLTVESLLFKEFENLKPDYIIELGSGLGSSAVWMADTCNSLGLKTHVYSFDIIKPNLKHKNVSFIKQDINNLEEFSELKFLKNINGKKIIIEDAHVNINNVLNFFDKYLKKDDYLIIEDSSGKQKSIKKFTDLKDAKYKVDQFYLDFFGTNITSCVNSIFKCF